MPVMTEEWQIKNQNNKRRWFLGNELAISFINQLFLAVELWDDLIDKDVEITDERINQVFIMLMFGLPSNDWFIVNRAHYLPLIMTSINGFHDANQMAKSENKKLRNLAFHIRNLGIEIHIATAFLIGGYDHMRNVSSEIREFFAFEAFEEWETEHARSN
jgi:hypothetical protein